MIESAIMLTSTALFDTNRLNISRGLNYLNLLNLEWGLAISFG